eukprot:TRINITY_DN81498_c0_g1_i1.p1 TRINITY_DN81498_c0_g1~~TRINITY_DN81498_c0_g1_i1.p1  ORF type:complete len:387 (-),score=65.78 TRINITY_DN81498_c0_g1_i1:25-1185(-)
MPSRHMGTLETVGMQIRLGSEQENTVKRLPAEVVRRTQKKSRVEQTVEVEVDLKVACSLKPARRLSWLNHACRMVKDGRATPKELFDIIITRRFAAGISRRLGKAMLDCLLDIEDIFTDKQQRHLRSDDWMLNRFRHDVSEEDAEEDESEERAESPRNLRTDVTRHVSRRESKPEPIPESGGWVSLATERPEASIVAKNSREEKQKERQRAVEREKEQKKLEEDVDSSLQLLESLTQQRTQSPAASRAERKRPPSESRRRRVALQPLPEGWEEVRAKDGSIYYWNVDTDETTWDRPRCRTGRRVRRRVSRSRSKGRASGRRGLSRSRSISVQMDHRDRGRGSGDNMSFEDALAARMAERDRNDTTRSSIVQENYQGKKPLQMKFRP